MVAYKHGDTTTPPILEKLVATGFWRMAPDGTYSPAQSFLPERMNVLADQIEIFGSAVLGLTINCARCHNHKYDPLPQRDYYRLSAILQTSYDPYDWVIPTKRNLDVAIESDRTEANKHNAPIEAAIGKLEQSLASIEKPLREKLLEERLAALPENVRKDLRAVIDVEQSKRSDVQKALAEKFTSVLTISAEDLNNKFPSSKMEADGLRKQIAVMKGTLWEKPQVRALYEMGGEASKAYLLRRGEALSPSEPVEPGVPTVLSSGLKPYRILPVGNVGWSRWRCQRKKACAGAVDHSAEPSADFSSNSEPHLDASLRPGNRAKYRQLRKDGDTANTPGITRLAGYRVRHTRMEHEVDAPAHSDFERLAAGLEDRCRLHWLATPITSCFPGCRCSAWMPMRYTILS